MESQDDWEANMSGELDRRGLSTREEALAVLVSMTVAKWGEAEREAAVDVYGRLSHGLIVNRIAHFYAEAIDATLAEAVEILLTPADRALLRSGAIPRTTDPSQLRLTQRNVRNRCNDSRQEMETFKRYFIAEQKTDGSIASMYNSEKYATIAHAKRDPAWGKSGHVVVEGFYKVEAGDLKLISRSIVALPEVEAPEAPKGSVRVTIAGRTENVPADLHEEVYQKGWTSRTNASIMAFLSTETTIERAMFAVLAERIHEGERNHERDLADKALHTARVERQAAMLTCRAARLPENIE